MHNYKFTNFGRFVINSRWTSS